MGRRGKRCAFGAWSPARRRPRVPVKLRAARPQERGRRARGQKAVARCAGRLFGRGERGRGLRRSFAEWSSGERNIWIERTHTLLPSLRSRVEGRPAPLGRPPGQRGPLPARRRLHHFIRALASLPDYCNSPLPVPPLNGDAPSGSSNRKLGAWPSLPPPRRMHTILCWALTKMRLPRVLSWGAEVKVQGLDLGLAPG